MAWSVLVQVETLVGIGFACCCVEDGPKTTVGILFAFFGISTSVPCMGRQPDSLLLRRGEGNLLPCASTATLVSFTWSVDFVVELHEVALVHVFGVVVDGSVFETSQESGVIHVNDAVVSVLHEAGDGRVVTLFPSDVIVSPGTVPAVCTPWVSDLDDLSLISILKCVAAEQSELVAHDEAIWVCVGVIAREAAQLDDIAAFISGR